MDQLEHVGLFAQTFAQFDPDLAGGTVETGGGIGALLFLLVQLGIAILLIAGFWKLFTKAGQPGWAVLIPIYNLVALLQIAKRPIWWLVLCLIPIVNFVVAIIVSIDIAKNFGKGVGFGICLALFSFIMYPILGFSSARYQPTAA